MLTIMGTTAVVAGLASTALIAAAPAGAAPTCTVQAHLPATLAVRGGHTLVRGHVTFSAGCDGVQVTARVNLVTGSGVSKGALVFRSPGASAATLLSAGPGTLHTALSARSTAVDASGAAVHLAITSTKVVLKNASSATISGTRRGNAYTITVGGKAYSQRARKFAGVGSRIAIQRHTSTGWRTWKTVTPAAGGKKTLTFDTSSRYSYRAQVLQTSTTWSSVSRSITPADTTPNPPPAQAPAPAPTSVYYANCAAARAAGAAPIYAGQPGYRAGLDRDGDGIACE